MPEQHKYGLILSETEELAGKTIAACSGDMEYSVCLKFTDGTFAIFDIERGYYGDSLSIVLCDWDEDISLHKARSLGLITQEQFTAENQIATAKSAEESKLRRQAEFLKLKAEFEGGSK